MPLILAAVIYGGVFVGRVVNDEVIQPYVQTQIEQDRKDWPVDQLGMQIEQKNELAFGRLK